MLNITMCDIFKTILEISAIKYCNLCTAMGQSKANVP